MAMSAIHSSDVLHGTLRDGMLGYGLLPHWLLPAADLYQCLHVPCFAICLARGILAVKLFKQDGTAYWEAYLLAPV